MAGTDALARGRTAFGQRAWGRAFADLSAADQLEALAPVDLQRLAIAAYLLGRDVDCEEILARAHLRWLDSGGVADAVRCAFWIAFSLLNRGELGPGSGWVARARRLLDDHQLDCVEQGYVLMPLGLQGLDSGDIANAYATFDQVTKFAERFRDPDLLALARFGTGLALLRLGESEAGMAMFDEAMVSISIREVSPIVTGIVYCGVIQECHGAFDLRRAQEWTAALNQWCEAQPDLVPYRGQCLVHRSQLLQLRGAWPEAMGEVRRACERLSTPPGQPALGMAIYQRAELHRLRGEFAKADTAYREAGHLGHPPQPGLALLRLAQGEVEAAEAALRVCLEQTQERLARPRLLAAYVEILLAAGDVSAARGADDELSDIALGMSMPLLDAVSARAAGEVLLAEGQAGPALAALRRSCDIWREIEAPYEMARTRELMGRAYRALDDTTTAHIEFDAAQQIFHRLGAGPDLSRLRGVRPQTGSHDPLTVREVQVLGLVAAGKSNRAIANELLISEHTVARHLQNIFAKLGLSSRTAATAYAYEHGLVTTPARGRNQPRPGPEAAW